MRTPMSSYLVDSSQLLSQPFPTLSKQVCLRCRTVTLLTESPGIRQLLITKKLPDVLGQQVWILP